MYSPFIMTLVALGASYLVYWPMERKSNVVMGILKDRRTLAIGAIVSILAIAIVLVYLFIYEKGNQALNYGSSYPAESIAASLFQVFASTENLLIGSIVFIDEIL
jgi:hypothetical protein